MLSRRRRSEDRGSAARPPPPRTRSPRPGGRGAPGPRWLALGGVLLRVPGGSGRHRGWEVRAPGGATSGRPGQRAAGDGSPPGRSVEDAELKLEARTRRRSARSLGSGSGTTARGGTRAAALGAGLSADFRYPPCSPQGSAAHLVCPGATARVGGQADEPARFQRTGRASPSAHTALAGHTRSDSNVAPRANQLDAGVSFISAV